ncbi:MAG: hypothetical protein ACK5Z6_13715, partial [Hyphomonadaceae bacterium]
PERQVVGFKRTRYGQKAAERLTDAIAAQVFGANKQASPTGIWRFVNHRAWCFAHKASFST